MHSGRLQSGVMTKHQITLQLYSTKMQKTDFKRQDKKMITAKQKKQKNQKTVKKRFSTKFSYWFNKVWHSISELIGGSQVLHRFFNFVVTGAPGTQYSESFLNLFKFFIFACFVKFHKSNEIFGVGPLNYACSPLCQPSTLIGFRTPPSPAALY